MKSLTIAYITARQKPCITWFVDSLARQVKRSDPIEVVIVDLYADTRNWKLGNNVRHVEPKPTVWQGKHRVTKDQWWAASSARNTAICLCRTEWIAFLDDRSVLLPGWLDAVKRAMAKNYALCGAYEKRVDMTVEDGVIRHGGTIVGEDSRQQFVAKHKFPNMVKAPGDWWFGCTNACPIEWALEVNGYDETCDGMGYEDVFFGIMLANLKHPRRYDTHMKIVEDRTPSEITDVMRREDKGVSPNDKSHAQLYRLRGLTRTLHPWNLAEIRQEVLRGKPWPKPTWPTNDWYDNQPIKDF